MQPKNSRNASAPGGGNIRALRLPKARARGWRIPAAAHSKRRRAAQSGDGWRQLSSTISTQKDLTPGEQRVGTGPTNDSSGVMFSPQGRKAASFAALLKQIGRASCRDRKEIHVSA